MAHLGYTIGISSISVYMDLFHYVTVVVKYKFYCMS